MRVTLDQLKHGDAVVFKGNGFLFNMFSFLLTIFEPDWRKLKWKPWHMGIAWGKDDDGWYVLEAYSPMVRLHKYTNQELNDKCRFYHRVETDINKSEEFLHSHFNERYDVLLYPYTMAQYFIRHYLNRRIPKLLDNRWTCWELEQHWENHNGQSWGSEYDCPLILDFMRAVKEVS